MKILGQLASHPKLLFGSKPRTTDTQWRHKSKISEKLGRCGRQNMLRPYLKTWDWELIFGRAVKAISSPCVRSPCTYLSRQKSWGQASLGLLFMEAIFMKYRWNESWNKDDTICISIGHLLLLAPFQKTIWIRTTNFSLLGLVYT